MLRLLIVDDEVIVRKWLTLVFQPFDKEFVVVDAAANGHEALEICRIHAIDIVITDIIMPDMDGMSFIQALREFNLHTQVIILSNHADFSLAQKGMSFGAAAYLLKGEITEEELLEATRRAGKKLAADDNPPSPSFLGISSHQVSELLTGGTGEVLQAFDRALISEKDTVWCIVFSQDVTPAVSSSLGILALLVGIPSAYIFARCEFRFKKAFFYVLLITRMSPGAVFVIPYFIAYKELGLLDTYIGLTLIYFASNLGIIVWSLRAFMEDIPISLEEAARIDGCSLLQTLFRISIPLATPGIASTAIL